MVDIFSFFKFYYYVVTNNKKRYEYAVENDLPILLTPMALMVIHMVLGFAIDIATGGVIGALTLMIYIPIVPLNLVIQHHHSGEYFRIQQRKRAEARRKQKEKEQQEQFNRFWKEAMEYAKRERMKREQQQQQYERQRQQRQHQGGQTRGSKLMESLRVLGLDSTATKKEVRSRYRALSKKHHPDLGGNKDDFIRINKAYKYILDNI